MRESPRQLEALKLVADGRFYPVLVEEPDGWHARWHAAGCDNVWVDEYVRSAAMSPLSEDAEDQRHESLHDAWMMALRSRTGLVRWDDAECRAFAAELGEWSGEADGNAAERSSLVFAFDPAAGVSCAIPKGRAALKALGQSCSVFPPLTGLKRDPEDPGRLVVRFSRSEAESFLRSGARQLADAGYEVAGVDLRAAVTAVAEITGDRPGEEKVKIVVRVAGEPVTADEIRFLLDQGSSLVYFRDHWIEVDRAILREALRVLEKGLGRNANHLQFALGIGAVGKLEIEGLAAGGWLRGLLERLRKSGNSLPGEKSLAIPGFNGELREYQRIGVEWISFLTEHGFGALLADDMGLGKTIQTIAWLLTLKSDRTSSRQSSASFRVLIVSPLTLVANWRHELRRFAPSLSELEVEVVSYNRLVREYSRLSAIRWTALVLDEAQLVKNPETQAAKAIRALRPPRRLALTGTPIENSVMDVWALEDFLNPGLLGDRRRFRERFAHPIEGNSASSAGGRLRHALEPFILRRMKSDPAVAAELGEKRVVREFCALSELSRRDYESALSTFRSTVHTAGDAFALLTELKLICDGEGKRRRLFDLLETIFANGESALVFTQYAKVGAELRMELKERFGREFPFLHGGLGPTEREKEIGKFNAGGFRVEGSDRRPNAMILSLRAGGFGINLVKATHVIHFDRWWNPAVENQATDRAYRIGQSEDVFVHLLITEGTLEERIDGMLERKESLKGLLKDGQEFWNAVRLEGGGDVEKA